MPLVHWSLSLLKWRDCELCNSSRNMTLYIFCWQNYKGSINFTILRHKITQKVLSLSQLLIHSLPKLVQFYHCAHAHTPTYPPYMSIHCVYWQEIYTNKCFIKHGIVQSLFTNWSSHDSSWRNYCADQFLKSSKIWSLTVSSHQLKWKNS
jgi:hypothetical protein